MGRLRDVRLETITELFLLVQAAHLKLHARAELEGDQLREARATLIRERLS
jgi:protein-arginine kinase